MQNGVVSGFVIPYRANLQIYYDLAERLDWFMAPWASLVTVFNSNSVVVDSLLWRFPDITISPITYFNGCPGSFEQHDWILFTNVSAPTEVYIFNAGLAAAGDTAEIILKQISPNGTPEDFPSEQTFEIGIVKYSDDGGILSPVPTPVVSDYFLNFEQPFASIAWRLSRHASHATEPP